MRIVIITILAIILTHKVSSQEHKHLQKSEVIARNKVYSIYQYDGLDSLGFIEKFPNAYYSKYNEEGSIIEDNNYLSFIDKNNNWIAEEYKNYYMYDTTGNQIAFIQMSLNSDEPFRIISVNSYNQNPGKHLNAYLNGEDEFTFSENDITDKRYFGDTLQIGKFRKRTYSINDSTIYNDIFYNKKEKIDSIVFYSISIGKSTQSESASSLIYHYDKNGSINKITRKHYSNRTFIKPHMIETYSYNLKGLVESRKIEFPENNSIEIQKFRYSFRE